MNEWCARDISRKIRSSQRLRGSAGVPLSLPLWLHQRPGKSRTLVADEEAAAVVRYITICIDGVSEYRIASQLERKDFESPQVLENKGIRKPEKGVVQRQSLLLVQKHREQNFLIP